MQIDTFSISQLQNKVHCISVKRLVRASYYRWNNLKNICNYPFDEALQMSFIVLSINRNES